MISRPQRPLAAFGPLLLASVIVLGVAAYWFSLEHEAETVTDRPLPSPPSPAASSASAPVAVLAKAAVETTDPFAPRTWEPPPPPMPLMPAAPPPPQAPPLPFRFFGRITDAGQGTSFTLTRGTEMLTVHVGDRIESNYLVDKFDGAQLHFIYLPMNIRQTLFVGNTNE